MIFIFSVRHVSNEITKINKGVYTSLIDNNVHHIQLFSLLSSEINCLSIQFHLESCMNFNVQELMFYGKLWLLVAVARTLFHFSTCPFLVDLKCVGLRVVYINFLTSNWITNHLNILAIMIFSAVFTFFFFFSI